MAQNQNKTGRPIPAGEINIREELEKYLRYWPWFVLAVIFALGLAYLKLRRTTPIYSTTATIIIKDGKNSQNSEMAAFAELGLLNGMNSNSIQNEIGILRSRRLMEEVVKALNINIVYYDEERLRNPELYRDTPFLVKPLSLDTGVQNSGAGLSISYSGNNRLQVTRTSDNKTFKTEFGAPLDLGFGKILIVRNDLVSKGDLEKDRPVLVNFVPTENVASAYRNKLNVRIKETNSSLIELSLDDAVRAKAQDVLDQLVLEYNREAIEDKNLVAMNTAEFIDERLAIIN